MSDSSESGSDKLLPIPAFLQPGGRSNRQKCLTLLVACLTNPDAHKDKHGPRQPDIPAGLIESSVDSDAEERNDGSD